MKRAAKPLAVALFLLPCASAIGQPGSGAAAVDPRALLNGEAHDGALDQVLREIERDPSQAGIWLDFAVALCQAGRTADVEKVLSHIEAEFAPPEGIRAVIQSLRESPCQGPRPLRTISVSAQRGFDTNVNQGASSSVFGLGSAFPGVVLPLSPEFLPLSDHFTALDTAASWNPNNGTRFNVIWREKRFDRLENYNTGILAVGTDREWVCADARCTAGALLGHVEFGGKDYQHLLSLQGGRTQSIGLSGTTLALEADVTRQAFPGQHNLDAWLAFARTTLRVPTRSAGQLQFSANLGVDVPSADRPGGRRTFAAIGARGNHNLPAGYMAEWSLQYQIGRDANVYSPGLIDLARQPRLQVSTLALVKPVSANQRLRLEFRHVSNNDTVSLFSYRSDALALSWQWGKSF